MFVRNVGNIYQTKLRYILEVSTLVTAVRMSNPTNPKYTAKKYIYFETDSDNKTGPAVLTSLCMDTGVRSGTTKDYRASISSRMNFASQRNTLNTMTWYLRVHSWMPAAIRNTFCHLGLYTFPFSVKHLLHAAVTMIM
jgi:hypothetical protein